MAKLTFVSGFGALHLKNKSN